MQKVSVQKDIAAMKLSAISGRGSKKDFVDIYFLLKQFTLKELIEFYTQKYFDGSEYLVLKSLTYFNDADTDVDVNLIEDISWEEVKGKILDTVRDYVSRKS